jgi:hypothetical protein
MKRFIGVHNYISEKIGLPLTHMIEFDSDFELVKGAVIEYATRYSYDIKDFHISEYECENWTTNDKEFPVKVAKYVLA